MQNATGSCATFLLIMTSRPQMPHQPRSWLGMESMPAATSRRQPGVAAAATPPPWRCAATAHRDAPFPIHQFLTIICFLYNQFRGPQRSAAMSKRFLPPAALQAELARTSQILDQASEEHEVIPPPSARGKQAHHLLLEPCRLYIGLCWATCPSSRWG